MSKKPREIGTACQIQSLFSGSVRNISEKQRTRYANIKNKGYTKLTIHTRFGKLTIDEICAKLGITKDIGYYKLRTKTASHSWVEVCNLPEFKHIK